MVPGAGIEPARLAAGDFESPASTNFTTRAGGRAERLRQRERHCKAFQKFCMAPRLEKRLLVPKYPWIRPLSPQQAESVAQ